MEIYFYLFWVAEIEWKGMFSFTLYDFVDNVRVNMLTTNFYNK